MKNNFSKQDLVELTKEQIVKVGGGGFAYDFAYSLRLLGIYYANGAGLPGYGKAVKDFAMNYRPV